MHARTTPLFATILLAICLAMAIATPACAPLGIKTDAQRIATACATASASVKVLTVANSLGKLNEVQQAQILTAIEIAQPVCAAETPPTLDDVKRAAFLAAIASLETAAFANAGGTQP